MNTYRNAIITAYVAQAGRQAGRQRPHHTKCKKKTKYQESSEVSITTYSSRGDACRNALPNVAHGLLAKVESISIDQLDPENSKLAYFLPGTFLN